MTIKASFAAAALILSSALPAQAYPRTDISIPELSIQTRMRVVMDQPENMRPILCLVENDLRLCFTRMTDNEYAARLRKHRPSSIDMPIINLVDPAYVEDAKARKVDVFDFDMRKKTTLQPQQSQILELCWQNLTAKIAANEPIGQFPCWN